MMCRSWRWRQQGSDFHPVFNILEAEREVILVNPQHMKAVPGRKTDVKESQWIADLLRHGLLSASFIPPAPIRRDLTRYRKNLVQERAQEINRLQKVLETANIKLASVVTDVLGKSGRDMLACIVAGERDALSRTSTGALTWQTAGSATGVGRACATPSPRCARGSRAPAAAATTGPLPAATSPRANGSARSRMLPAAAFRRGRSASTFFPSDAHLACLRWCLPGQLPERRQTQKESVQSCPPPRQIVRTRRVDKVGSKLVE